MILKKEVSKIPVSDHLAHFVVVAFLHLGKFATEIYINVEVKITLKIKRKSFIYSSFDIICR